MLSSLIRVWGLASAVFILIALCQAGYAAEVDEPYKEFSLEVKTGGSWELVFQLPSSCRRHEYTIDGVAHTFEAERLILREKNWVIDTGSKETVLDWEGITGMKICLGEGYDDSLWDPLRQAASFTQRLKFKEPVVLNSWVTIDGVTTGRMVQEVIVLEGFLLILTQPPLLHMFPLSVVEEWHTKDVTGTPEDVVRDFIHDVRTKQAETIDSWLWDSGFDLNRDLLLDKDINPVDQSFTICSGERLAAIIHAWNARKQCFQEFAAFFRRIQGEWKLVALFPPAL